MLAFALLVTGKSGRKCWVWMSHGRSCSNKARRKFHFIGSLTEAANQKGANEIHKRETKYKQRRNTNLFEFKSNCPFLVANSPW